MNPDINAALVIAQRAEGWLKGEQRWSVQPLRLTFDATEGRDNGDTGPADGAGGTIS